ncbi:hypothetical protein LEMLEM_LOCUS11785, partial [Lemmus lemmus]
AGLVAKVVNIRLRRAEKRSLGSPRFSKGRCSALGEILPWDPVSRVCFPLVY